MSDAKGPANDPSMDDILASIRKIISDDEARAQASGAAPPASQPAEAGTASAPPPGTRDDVLLLTELLDEPATGLPPLQAPGQPAQATPIAAERPAAAVEPPMKQPPADQSLVESSAAGLAASAFDRLNQAVQGSVSQPAASDPGPSVGPSGRNLEDIVKELLRPMLKEWLDKNLPTVVERSVEREIVRLTRR
jgi:cell pole-organizing protein PopZ